MWSIKCGVWSVTSKVWSLKCRVWRVESRVLSVECKVERSVKCRVRSVKMQRILITEKFLAIGVFIHPNTLLNLRAEASFVTWNQIQEKMHLKHCMNTAREF